MIGHIPCPRSCGEGWSATSASTGRFLECYLVDGDPHQDRGDGHEARECCDDRGKGRGLVRALDAYPHQDHQGVGKSEGPEYGYPGEHQGGRGVGGHAVDLREARHLPGERPDREKIHARRHTYPDRREHGKEQGANDRRPHVRGVQSAEKEVRGQGDRGCEDARDRADQQHEDRGLPYGPLDLEVQVETPRGEQDCRYHSDRARERTLQVELGGFVALHEQDYTGRSVRACQIALRNIDLGPSKMVAERMFKLYLTSILVAEVVALTALVFLAPDVALFLIPLIPLTLVVA